MRYLWEDQLERVLAAVQRIESKLGVLMSQDQTIAAEAADEETSIQAATVALSSIQGLLSALQAEGQLSQPTLDAAAKVQSDLDALAQTAQADATADQPAATPPADGTTPAAPAA